MESPIFAASITAKETEEGYSPLFFFLVFYSNHRHDQCIAYPNLDGSFP
jgi:hypothetical protein